MVRARPAADRERRHRRLRRRRRRVRRAVLLPRRRPLSSAACRCCATNSTSPSPGCSRSSSMRSPTSWARSPSAARRDGNCCKGEDEGLARRAILLGGAPLSVSPQGSSCRAARSSSSAPVTPAFRPPPACARKARTTRSSCSRASPTCPISARRCRRRSSRARWTSPACRCAPSNSIARSRSTSGSAFRRRASTSPARRVELGADGAEPFDHLILATGARPRPFAIPGADLDGVLDLAQHRRRGSRSASGSVPAGASSSSAPASSASRSPRRRSRSAAK